MHTRILTSLLALCLAVPAVAQDEEEGVFTSDFHLGDCRVFLPNGGNDFWTLQPGVFTRFEGEDDGELIELEITVTRGVRPIVFFDGDRSLLAIARIIEEREWEGGELVEVSRNYYARCRDCNDIFYFGEQVDIYEDGEIVSHDGEWLAGVDGAQPGLIMPGRWLLGSRYYQEIASNAQDRAEHVEMGFDYTTEAGDTFTDCARIIETTPLEPGAESEKIYARGIGLIYDDGVELVERRLHGRVVRHDGEDAEEDAARGRRRR